MGKLRRHEISERKRAIEKKRGEDLQAQYPGSGQMPGRKGQETREKRESDRLSTLKPSVT